VQYLTEVTDERPQTLKLASRKLFKLFKYSVHLMKKEVVLFFVLCFTLFSVLYTVNATLPGVPEAGAGTCIYHCDESLQRCAEGCPCLYTKDDGTCGTLDEARQKLEETNSNLEPQSSCKTEEEIDAEYQEKLKTLPNVENSPCKGILAALASTWVSPNSGLDVSCDYFYDDLNAPQAVAHGCAQLENELLACRKQESADWDTKNTAITAWKNQQEADRQACEQKQAQINAEQQQTQEQEIQNTNPPTTIRDEDFWHSSQALEEMQQCFNNCPTGYTCVYGKTYNGCGRIPKDKNQKCIDACPEDYICTYDVSSDSCTQVSAAQLPNGKEQQCRSSCASFYVCSWENGQCIKRIPEAQLAQARQVVGSAIDSWRNKAAQLPLKKVSDDQGNSVATDSLKLQGVGTSLPEVDIEYPISNRKIGEVVSAKLPEGATVISITTTLRQPTADATMAVSVIYGKDWQKYKGANGAPDYPIASGEQVDKMLVVNTKNNDQPYSDYSQALIEYSTTSDSYAYSSSDSRVTPEQLKSQQDFFKYLESKSNAAQYQQNNPHGYTFDQFANLLLGEQAPSNSAKGIGVAIYNENTKTWEKLPSWKIGCEGNTCRYAALAPHLSTFAIILKNPSTPSLTSFWVLLIIVLVEIAVVIFLHWFLKKKEGKKGKSTAKGTASLVLGIIGIIFFLAPYIAILLSGLALVFSLSQKRTNPTKNATTGFVLSIIGLCLSGILFISMMIGMLAFG